MSINLHLVGSNHRPEDFIYSDCRARTSIPLYQTPTAITEEILRAGPNFDNIFVAYCQWAEKNIPREGYWSFYYGDEDVHPDNGEVIGEIVFRGEEKYEVIEKLLGQSDGSHGGFIFRHPKSEYQRITENMNELVQQGYEFLW